MLDLLDTAITSLNPSIQKSNEARKVIGMELDGLAKVFSDAHSGKKIEAG